MNIRPSLGIRALWARLQSNETLILWTLALVLGVAAGAGVWLFKRLIDLFQWLAFDLLRGALQPLGAWTVILVPVVGGLLVGLTVYFFVGEERHHGVAGIIEAVALAGGRLHYTRALPKVAAAALGIGFGASVGPEDPSVQIGANLGSMFGQRFRLSDERVRALAAAGGAAGIAAAFNAPIAGVFFALEVILGEIGGPSLGVVVVAAVASAVFTQAVSGVQPAFHVPPYAYSTFQLPFYIGLGLLAGPVAALYVRAIYWAQDRFHAWHAPRWVKPALAGAVVGLVGLFLPGIFGVGYGTIEQILGGERLVFGLLLALLFAKLAMTAASIGGGFMGGLFAPSLYLGATLGGAYALLIDRLVPGLTVDPPAFAMVGMAAVLAGAVHSPLTAMILLFEMTNDYRIILPLMFAVVLSLLVSQFLIRDSVYSLGLARKGIRLERGRDVEVLQGIRVDEVMHPLPLATLNANDRLKTAAELFNRTRRHGLAVVNDGGELVGILTVSDLDRAQASGEAVPTVGELMTHEVLVAYPDQTLSEALRVMSTHDVGRLPVVDPGHPTRLVGMLRRGDVIRAYDLALSRRAALRHRAQQVRLGALLPAESRAESIRVAELVVEPDSPCAGQAVKAIPWPKDCVIASVRRGRQVLIPHGDTLLRPGDVLVAVLEGHVGEMVQELCRRG